MMCNLLRRLVPACLLVAGSQPAQITFQPPTCQLTLHPRERTVQRVKVTIRGETRVNKADVYVLADTTGSMGPVLANVRSNATAIVRSLLTAKGDLAIGVGEYKDFPYDGYAFRNNAAISRNEGAIVNGINMWTPSGGIDAPEGQLFALHKLATDPAIGWRQDAKRVIVWFGDAPGHDPICTAISNQVTRDITEFSVISDLVVAGPGGTAVIAISAPTGVAGALNADPVPLSRDYSPKCSVGGAPDQARRIATATGGIDTLIRDPSEITQKILDTIGLVLAEVDVTLVPTATVAPFFASISPPVYRKVKIPADPQQSVSLDFDLELVGTTCQKGRLVVNGGLDVRFDGAPAGGSKPVVFDQPGCGSVGLLLLGLNTFTFKLPPAFPGPADHLLTTPVVTVPVTMANLPVLSIPNDPGLHWALLFTQVLVFNPVDFVKDPVKTSNGLQVVLGDQAIPFGPASGVSLQALEPTPVGGRLVQEFVIDG